jgi:proton glutamate symport protein
MGRTAVNLTGNCVATAVIARWEGVFDDVKMRAFGQPVDGLASENLIQAPLRPLSIQ